MFSNILRHCSAPLDSHGNGQENIIAISIKLIVYIFLHVFLVTCTNKIQIYICYLFILTIIRQRNIILNTQWGVLVIKFQFNIWWSAGAEHDTQAGYWGYPHTHTSAFCVWCLFQDPSNTIIVQQAGSLFWLKASIVFTLLHCNIRFLPIAPGFTILECLHRCLAPGRGATHHAGALPRGGDNNNGFANSSSPLLQRCALSSSCSSVVVCDGVNHLPMLPH